MSVQFIEEGHQYIDKEGLQYTSTTTVIGKYKEPFDGEYWSLYKAIERFITETKGGDEWIDYKRAVGYKQIVPNFKTQANAENTAIILGYQVDIKAEWDFERNIACFNGTNFHEGKEAGWLQAPVHFDGVKKKNWHNLGIQNMEGVNINPKDLPDGVYSELILWNNRYRVAGAADIVYLETIDGIRYVDIDDYKTNKKIETSSYFNHKTKRNKMMLTPLNNIMDCNGCHYELQISTYGYYLECFGFVVRYLNFQHYKNVAVDEDGEMDKKNPRYEFAKNYELEYKKKEVVKMLEHHKKKNN